MAPLAQIRTSYGLHVDGYLKGDLIYFPHEGPCEAVLAIEDRAAWIRERGAIQFVLAGEECKSDSLHRWMQATNVVRARPEVCYNHLRMRRRLEVVCGGRTADFDEPLPTFDTLTALLSGMERELADTIEDEDNKLCPRAMGAERLAQLENSDIAQVRVELADLAATRQAARAGHHDQEAEDPSVTHCGVWASELTGEEATRRNLMCALASHPHHHFQDGMSVWYRDACDEVVAATVRDQLPPDPHKPQRRRYEIQTEAGEVVNVFAGQLRPWSGRAPTAETWDDVEVYVPLYDAAAAGDEFGFDDDGRPCVLHDAASAPPGALAPPEPPVLGAGGGNVQVVDATRLRAFMQGFIATQDLDVATPGDLKNALAAEFGVHAGRDYDKQWFWRVLFELLAPGAGGAAAPHSATACPADGVAPPPIPLEMCRVWVRLASPDGGVHITPALAYGKLQLDGLGLMYDVCVDADQQPLHMSHLRLRAYDVGAWSKVPPRPEEWADHRPFEALQVDALPLAPPDDTGRA